MRATLEARLTPPFSLIPRDQLDAIWAEVKLGQVTTTPNPEQVLQDLKLTVTQQATLPLDAIIISEYGQLPGNPQQIRVYLYLIDVKNVRKYTEAGTLHLTQAQALDSYVHPTAYDQTHQRIESSSQVVQTEITQLAQDNSDLQLDPQEIMFNLFVSVDKGPGAVYEDGDPMTIRVSAETDCYIAAVNVDSSDRWGVLFPNHLNTDNFLRAGELIQIPPEGETRYDLGIQGPNFGMEKIKVFASTTPFDPEDLLPQASANSEAGVKAVRRWVKSVVLREKQNARLAEAECIFITKRQSSKGVWVE